MNVVFSVNCSLEDRGSAYEGDRLYLQHLLHQVPLKKKGSATEEDGKCFYLKVKVNAFFSHLIVISIDKNELNKCSIP